MINEIIEERSKGNPAIKEMTIAKLILKGFNPKNFDENSKDDEILIESLMNIAKQLNIKKFKNNGINIKTVFSTKSMEDDIIVDIKSQLNFSNIKLIIFFASTNFDQEKLSNLMQETFNESIIVRCSAPSEIISGELLNDSVVVMAIYSNVIFDAKVEIIEDIKQNSSIEKAFTSFEEYYNESLYTMDIAKFVGITLVDGLSMREEKIMDIIGNRTNVFFVGGSAGDNNEFLKTRVHENGKAYTDCAIIILLKINPSGEFIINKMQSFRDLERTVIVNKVNEENHRVVELDNKPSNLTSVDYRGTYSIEEVSKYCITNPIYRSYESDFSNVSF